MSYDRHKIRPKKVQNIALMARLELAQQRNARLKILKNKKLSKPKEIFM